MPLRGPPVALVSDWLLPTETLPGPEDVEALPPPPPREQAARKAARLA